MLSVTKCRHPVLGWIQRLAIQMAMFFHLRLACRKLGMRHHSQQSYPKCSNESDCVSFLQETPPVTSFTMDKLDFIQCNVPIVSTCLSVSKSVSVLFCWWTYKFFMSTSYPKKLNLDTPVQEDKVFIVECIEYYRGWESWVLYFFSSLVFTLVLDRINNNIILESPKALSPKTNLTYPRFSVEIVIVYSFTCLQY